MRSLLDDLNDKQKEAVTAPMGPVLVLAGAGSGKTRVLTYRLAWLLEKKFFRPEEILALTFTNKAAGEMKERILKLLSPSPSIPLPRREGGSWGITMGTFHSVCVRILREDIAKLGRGHSQDFVIYDADDSKRLIKQIVMEKGLEERFRHQVFSYYISAAKNQLTEPKDLAIDNDYLRSLLQEVYEIYEQRLTAYNALDFDDLLKLVCELFLLQEKVLKKYQNRFRYVLVDEYQDTNHAQYLILEALVREHKNIFVVGDDAQSIYGFRGANMQNILDFEKDYSKAKLIMLEQNYRSSQNILDAAHKVIALNPFQYEKKLWTENDRGQKIYLYEARDEMDEAQFVVKNLANHNAPSPPSYLNSKFLIPQNLKDFVILYRTHAQSRPMEEVLVSSGIPYQIIGGIKFYERREIKDVLSYLRLLLNPRDLVSLSRVINVPARGIGSVNFKLILKTLPKYNFNFGRVNLNLEKFELQPKALYGARDFFEIMSQAGQISPKENLLALMDFLLATTNYKDELLKDKDEGLIRWENIEELYSAAARFKHLPWGEGLRGFLEEAALMTDFDKAETGGNKLTLMTLHSAKGLEFEKVFLVGVEEGLLPHSRSLGSAQELAEEIRLAYVGMTRAKRELFLSYAKMRQTYGELKRAVPSRIIKAIPKRLLHKLN